MIKAKRVVSYIILTVLCAVLSLFSACSYSGCSLLMSTREWVIETIKRYYYEDIDDSILQNCDYRNLRGTVLDIYSGFYTAEEYKALYAANAGNRSGVGLATMYIEDAEFGTGLFIEEVVGNSPAYISGLKRGMWILSGSTAGGGACVFDSLDAFAQFVDERATGEKFTLTTDKGDFEVYKSNYTESYCFMATKNSAWECVYEDGVLSTPEAETKKMEFLPEGAAYLSLYQFYGGAAAEMAELFKIFNENGCTSLILDLRNNGGGYVSVMNDISYLFCGDLDGYISYSMYEEDKYGNINYEYMTKWTGGDSLLPAGTDVYVLANNGTASASEALMGVLYSNHIIDYSDVYISDFGDNYLQFAGMENKDCRTYGKGIMQAMFLNYKGEALKLTTAKIYWPDGNCIHEKGLVASASGGCNAVKADWNVTYNDEELQRAVNRIYGLN